MSLRFPFVWSALLMTLSLNAPTRARGSEAVDLLLRLAPADAGLTIVVEDLKGHSRAFLDSPLAAGLNRLPAVTAWMGSERGRAWRQSTAQIEAILKTDFARVRDGLIGEAVVLALRIPPGGRPEDARGLLLSRVPDRPLLDRAIAHVNGSQIKKGELVRVSERRRAGAAYFVREHRAGTQPDECYAHLGDRVFAWSNSEELLLGVLDRQSKGSSGLDGLADVQRIRRRSPARTAVGVFVDPRFVERLMAAAPGSIKAADERLMALFGGYLAAVRYAGAALEWRDGPVFHTEEVVDGEKLPLGLKAWADRTDDADPSLLRVPPTALAFATAHLDARILIDAVSALVPEDAKSKLDNLGLALNGLLLGLDARRDVAPHLGPGVAAYLERPIAGAPAIGLPLVVQMEVGREPGGEKAAAALKNALRTVLAFYALDDAHGGGMLRVESAETLGASVTTLSPETPLAFSIADGRLVVARSRAAVARALAARRDPTAGGWIEHLRATHFPGVQSFACADLHALHEFASPPPRRAALARRIAEGQGRDQAEVVRDLDQALALIALFDTAFFTNAIEPGYRGVHRTLGLVAAPTTRP